LDLGLLNCLSPAVSQIWSSIWKSSMQRYHRLVWGKSVHNRVFSTQRYHRVVWPEKVPEFVQKVSTVFQLLIDWQHHQSYFETETYFDKSPVFRNNPVISKYPGKIEIRPNVDTSSLFRYVPQFRNNGRISIQLGHFDITRNFDTTRVLCLAALSPNAFTGFRNQPTSTNRKSIPMCRC
jgi:hypothetical protein